MFEMTGGPDELTPEQQRRLENLEREAEFVEDRMVRFLGPRLREIREDRLYRRTHRRIEDYARERFDRGRHWANRQIAAFEVMEWFDGHGLPAPTCESKAR